MRVGDRDGHGRYGTLDVDDDGRLICHECGRGFDHLSTHAAGAHGMGAEDYRTAHGLARTAVLVSDRVRDRMRAANDRNRDGHLARLEAHRQPAKATEASRRAPWSPATREARATAARERRGRDLDAEERAWLDETGYDLQAWCDRARILLAHDDVSIRSLADAADITPASAWQRLRRYPPRVR